MKRILIVVIASLLLSGVTAAQQAPEKTISKGAKVFVAPMADNFQEYLKAALVAKKVPITIVENKAQADFEISGHSDTEKASTAKKVIMWDWRSNEQASIQVANLKSGDVVFAYSVNKKSSAHGKKSTAEACAKHLKEKIESGT